MEDENDEQSAYHPHDLAKYCQFCLDRLHPVTVERPFTVNPIIPLVDPIYDHVIKRYPKRSFCILRNCIRVSDLISSTKSSVFELLRPKNSDNICSRLRKRKRPVQPQRNLKKQKISKVQEGSEVKMKMGKNESKTSEEYEIDALHGMIFNSEEKSCENISRTQRRSKRLSTSISPLKSVQTTPKISAQKLLKDSPKSEKSLENFISFEDWQKETTLAISSQRMVKNAQNLPQKCPNAKGEMCLGCNAFYANADDPVHANKVDYSCAANSEIQESDWVPPSEIKYREITQWPHLNECIGNLEILNIGGTNVLGEFIPFILLHAKNLKSLGQWINTMIYGLEILRELPGKENLKFPNIQEFSYSTDRNYFCQVRIYKPRGLSEGKK